MGRSERQDAEQRGSVGGVSMGGSDDIERGGFPRAQARVGVSRPTPPPPPERTRERVHDRVRCRRRARPARGAHRGRSGRGAALVPRVPRVGGPDARPSAKLRGAKGPSPRRPARVSTARPRRHHDSSACSARRSTSPGVGRDGAWLTAGSRRALRRDEREGVSRGPGFAARYSRVAGSPRGGSEKGRRRGR